MEFMVIVMGFLVTFAVYGVSNYIYDPEFSSRAETINNEVDYWPGDSSRFEAMIPDFSDVTQFITAEVKLVPENQLAYMPEDHIVDSLPQDEQNSVSTIPDLSDPAFAQSYYGQFINSEVIISNNDAVSPQNDGALQSKEDQHSYNVNMSTTGIIQLTEKEDRFQYPLNMLRDLKVWPVKPSEVLYFWHIPKTAGTSLKHVLEFCYGLIRAEKYREPQSLEILYKGKHRFVNVGTDTPTAIIEARKIKLVESGMVQTIASSFFYEGTFLFTPDHRGRMVTMLRHPVERAHSLFHYLAQATWEPTYDPALASMSFLDYGRSNRAEDNWIVRYLTNRKQGPLSYYYVELATEVLRTKCLVGFMDYYEESIRRIEKYYGFKEKKEGCTQYYIDTPVNKYPHPPIEVGSVEWNLFARINKYDVKLYENAELIFQEQGIFLGSLIETI